MRMANWIRKNQDEILSAWDRDAQQILSLKHISQKERRDHAQVMLDRVSHEMEQTQTDQEQAEKSKGLGAKPEEITGAQRHGASRMQLGAGVVEVAMEFRALRQSVIRLWTRSEKPSNSEDFEDLIRFDQAVDQALTESLESFASERSRHERVLQTMLSAQPDPSFILDLEGRFLYANMAATKLYKTSLNQLIGKTFGELKLPVKKNLSGEAAKAAQNKETVFGEFILRESSDICHHYEYTYKPVLNEQEQAEAVVGTMRNITERRTSEARLWRHANYDLLTQLPNRRLFRDRLKQHTKHSERTGSSLALFFIDFDRFKEVNDQLGHDAGDLLLQQASKRICGCVRTTDTVSRLGGDEFTVILLDVEGTEQIDQIARDILAELAQPFYLRDQLVTISGSIGITRYPHDARTISQLLKNADKAMYAAKKSGRHRFCHYAQTIERAEASRAKLASDLRKARVQNQLELHYQPIMNLKDDRIAKAEAMLRWFHPSLGLLFPAEFIELAEETGVIREIETWAFTEAASHSKEWNQLNGPAFQISLNTSSLEFCHHTEEVSWAQELKRLDLCGSNLVIELTEKIFSADEELLVRKLAALKDAGIAVALDDFGTGQFSLACLKKFNITYLKIDPSFVQEEVNNDNGREIAETIITMAHQLGLKVIAEGVETQEQSDWLKAAGCDFAQGFYFARPLSADDFTEHLNARYAQ